MKKRQKGREKKKDKKVVYRGYNYPSRRDGTCQEYDEYYTPAGLEIGLEVEDDDNN